jgi:hypothetical protein
VFQRLSELCTSIHSAALEHGSTMLINNEFAAKEFDTDTATFI